MFKNEFADLDIPSLADVAEALRGRADLAPARRRDLMSGVSITALWLNRTPDEVPASHDYLRRCFERLNAAALGVSPGRFANVRSLLKAALEAAGIPTSGRSYLMPLLGDWKMLYDALPDPYAKECLARFMRYSSRLGIAPAAVDQAVLDAFREALAREDLTARPLSPASRPPACGTA